MLGGTGTESTRNRPAKRTCKQINFSTRNGAVGLRIVTGSRARTSPAITRPFRRLFDCGKRLASVLCHDQCCRRSKTGCQALLDGEVGDVQLLCFAACALVSGMQVSLNEATPDRPCCKFARCDPSGLPWVCSSEMTSARPGGTCDNSIPVHCRALITVLIGAHRDRGVYCSFPHAECNSVHL